MHHKVIALRGIHLLNDLVFSSRCSEGCCLGFTGMLESIDQERRVFSFGARTAQHAVVVTFFAGEYRSAVPCQVAVSDLHGCRRPLIYGTSRYADLLWESTQNPVRFLPKILAELKIKLTP